MVGEYKFDGLTEHEAETRLKYYGYNRISSDSSIGGLKIFLSQFKSPLIYILIFAGLIAFVLKNYSDSVVIFVASIINAMLGFWQEYKANKVLSSLKKLLIARAKVIRGGIAKEILVDELVPGDVVVLEIGMRVPADGILVEANDIAVDEAILTGESEAVRKKVGDTKEKSLVFAGTVVAVGIGKMLVTATGNETKIGKMGDKLQLTQEEKTPLQKQLDKLAKWLSITIGIGSVAIFAVQIILGRPIADSLVLAVAVAVATIPEGLVVSLTVIMAVGMQRIVEKKGIVKTLLAAETLGSVTTICCDKTGTLTEGKMRVVEAVGEGYRENRGNGGHKGDVNNELLVRAAILCNDMRDPLEVAMANWAGGNVKSQKSNVKSKEDFILERGNPAIKDGNLAISRKDAIEKIKQDYPRIDEIPFSPKYKYIVTLHDDIESRKSKPVFLSGAPEVVLRKCRISNKELGIWNKTFEDYAGRGNRIVGFAYKEEKLSYQKIQQDKLDDFEWLGILVYEDPVREGVKESLMECRRIGIKVKVITGDYPATAAAILNKLEIQKEALTNEEIMTGDELREIPESDFESKIDKIILFARVNPEEKLKIVQALKNKGESVAMMGDGVNDALALKQADIGIVVGDASDVAKESADMILLDSNFSTVISVIEEGRGIYGRIKNVITYLMVHSFDEALLIFVAIMATIPPPLIAAQLLWLNLVEHSLFTMGLSFERTKIALSSGSLRRKDDPLIDRRLRNFIVLSVVISNAVLFCVFIFTYLRSADINFSRTIIFLILGFNSCLTIYSSKRLDKPVFSLSAIGNRNLNILAAVGLLMLLIAIYFPPIAAILKTTSLSISGIGIVIFFSILVWVIFEINKHLFLYNKNGVS